MQKKRLMFNNAVIRKQMRLKGKYCYLTFSVIRFEETDFYFERIIKTLHL